MNRSSVALLSALEAVLTVAIGIAVALVPLTVLWAVDYGFAVDWLVIWRAAADSWLLGNGVDLVITLPDDLIASLGVVGASESFPVTIAPLGFAMLTVLMAYRTGRRAARTGRWGTAAIASVAVFAVLSLGATLSALDLIARPSIVQGTVIPPVIYTLGLALGALAHRMAEGTSFGVPFVAERLQRHHVAVLAAAARGGAAAFASIVAAAAVLLAIVIIVNYSVIIGLYEAAQPTVMGVVMTTLAQLAFIPNAVAWVASWLIGPGFAIGADSAISPVNTVVGPLPGVPLLGAVPTGDFTFGFVGLIVPLIAGFLAATMVRRRLVAALDGRSVVMWLALGAIGIGVVAGVLLGLLAWFSGGAVGPGRLVDVGPHPLLVGAIAAAEVTIAAAIGMASGSSNSREEVALDEREKQPVNDPKV